MNSKEDSQVESASPDRNPAETNPAETNPVETDSAESDSKTRAIAIEHSDGDADNERPNFIVGIGASAGGLEALQRLFDNMPADTGMAFVVVQHLSPDFKSLMGELLSRHTDMPVYRVENGMPVRRNCVYLIPPKKEMTISNGRLYLTDKDLSHGLTLPIDLFFRSLAKEAGRRAIGIILSGTGSDGSRGIVAIREAGGLVIAQDTATARFDGMPKAAVETGAVDLVLPPDQIAETLLRCANHPLKKVPVASPDGSPGLKDVFKLLHDEYGIDFSHYKPSTVMRRIERRLLLQRAPSFEAYCRQLQNDPEELNRLYCDLLIGVTQFFRDPEAFELISRDVLPDLISNVPADEDIRLWVAGCATGEEAYSLAIIVHEQLTAMERPLNVKLFATDAHRSSLDTASLGIYSPAALADVSPERLKRYFTRLDDGMYRVVNDLRNLIVFAPHNLIKDAPFTRLDMVTCRNLLIYLQPHAQKKVLSMFHFALKVGGVLFLGPSEGPGDLASEFDAIDQHWKLYRKRRDTRLTNDLGMSIPITGPVGNVLTPPPLVNHRSRVDQELLGVYDVVLQEFMPPALLIDRRGQLVHAFRGAGRFLSVRDGRPTAGVLDQLPVEIRIAVQGTLQRADPRDPVVFRRIQIPTPDGPQVFDVGVRSLKSPHSDERFVLITFAGANDEVNDSTKRIHAEHQPIGIGSASREQIAALESELQYTRENLQATIEELETSNEELQATNEELLASNEELQSTNEELHSVNEELYTVNAEYQKKIEELTELTTDMDNLLECTQVHTIFLDRTLRIRKFTPQIAETFHLVEHDIGRRIDSFSPSIQYPKLVEDAEAVLEHGETIEREVSDHQGNWYLVRILPYRKRGEIDGVVVTLIDISRRKKIENDFERTNNRFRNVLENLPSIVFLKDTEGRYELVNPSFEKVFGRTEEEVIGKRDVDIFPPELAWTLSRHDQSAMQANEPVEHQEELAFPDGTTHTFLVTKFAIRDEDGTLIGIGGIKTDITALKAAEDDAIEAVAQRDRFLAVLSHELRNPLGALMNAVQLLTRSKTQGQVNESAIGVIERQSQHMARLLDDLLDVSRVTVGKIEMRFDYIDLRDLIDEAVEAARPQIDARHHQLDVKVADHEVPVRGDRARLLQIVENLLSNAAKYTPDGGRIDLILTQDKTDAVIRVRDNGHGIPSHLLDSVFHIFVQNDETLHRADGGMGVGLTLVESLVKLHGGQITAHSDGIGKGSEFEVRLPLASAVEYADDGPHAKGDENSDVDRERDWSAPPENRKLRIVVVEDQDDNREMLRELLELEGCEVYTASDGNSGLELILNQRPDIALIDIGLPQLDGYTVAERVRETLGDNAVELIALTGYGREEDRKKVIAAGFHRHLVKPLKPADIDSIARQQTSQQS